MESNSNDFGYLLSPFLILLGALVLKDGLIMLKESKYPPPLRKWLSDFLHINLKKDIEKFGIDEQDKLNTWIRTEAYKDIFYGIFIIIIIIFVFFVSLL